MLAFVAAVHNLAFRKVTGNLTELREDGTFQVCFHYAIQKNDIARARMQMQPVFQSAPVKENENGVRSHAGFPCFLGGCLGIILTDENGEVRGLGNQLGDTAHAGPVGELGIDDVARYDNATDGVGLAQGGQRDFQSG